MMRRLSDIQQELADLISFLREVHNPIPNEFASQLQWQSWQNRLEDLEKELQETIEYEHRTKGERIMSEWITDRAPTKEDSLNGYIMVWLQCYQEAWPINVYHWHSSPWMPIPKPEPYVAPKPPNESQPYTTR